MLLLLKRAPFLWDQLTRVKLVAFNRLSVSYQEFIITVSGSSVANTQQQ